MSMIIISVFDYFFYTDQYMGSVIPESAFQEAGCRAKDALERFERIYTVTSSGEVARNMALCAMAEVIYLQSKRAGGITAASVGNASVHYGSQSKSLNRQLLEKAAIYLDIRRGVSG